MTGLELARALDREHMSQAELARRLGITSRNVRFWLESGVPDPWADRVVAAIATRPRIQLSRNERLELSELLDRLATLHTVSSADVKVAARYRDKIRASVGGYVASA